MGDILTKAGFNVFKGYDGRNGLEVLTSTEENMSMIITDLFMPGMDGIDLIKEIRKLERYQYIPILMLTTESHMAKKMEAKKAGVTGWMVKPFEEEKLLKTVHKIIR